MTDLKDITQDLTNTARDAAYVAVGFGVLAFQRAQVRRQEMLKTWGDPRTRLDERLGAVRDDVARVVKGVEGQVESVIHSIEVAVEPLEDRLPGAARDLVKQAHTQAREARTQILGLLHSLAA